MISKKARNALRILLAPLLIVSVILLVFSYFLSLPFGTALFFFTPEGAAFSTRHLSALPIELFMTVSFTVPLAVNVGLAFLSLLAVYILCFVGAWVSRESFHEVVRKGSSRPLTKLFNNNLFAMPIIASMLYIAVIALTFFQESQGIPTDPAPEWSPFETFFVGGTLLPIVEEVSFRLSSIGVFLIIYLLLVGREKLGTFSAGQTLKVALLIPLYPDKAKELLCVKTVSEFGFGGISLGEWIMIVVTSLVFGWVHVGHPWGPGKFTTATLVGFGLGLAYLFYGAQAPVLLHWFFNYYWSGALSLTLHYYANSLPIVFTIFLIWILTSIMGGLGWLVFGGLFGARVYERVKSWWCWRRKRTVPAPPLSTQTPTKNHQE